MNHQAVCGHCWDKKKLNLKHVSVQCEEYEVYLMKV